MISARPNKKKRSEGIDNTLSTVFEYFGGDQIVPNDIEEVHINPKVTNIKDGAFSGNKSLKKIVVLNEGLRSSDFVPLPVYANTDYRLRLIYVNKIYYVK